MYVPGNLDEISTVLVELGTGYYADMVRVISFI